MAASRYGGYRNHELREREFELKSTRRNDYRDHQNDRSSRDGERERRDLRDQLRKHRTGGEEREPRNGHRRPQRSGSNSSAGSGSDKNRDVTAHRPVDREPGELSSGSESPVSRDNGVRKVENGSVLLPSKKRKFSPIVWDLDELKKSNGVLPPPPPLPQGYVSARSAEGPLLPPEPPFSPPENHLFSDDPEPGEMEVEDEENIFARNISTSRWAAGNDALEDEAPAKAEPKMRSAPLSNSQSAKQRSQSKLPSPEPGEVILREGSERAVSRSSHSDGEQRDEQKELEADSEDYMDVDSKEDNEGGSDHLTGTDSESESSRGTSPESPETGKLAQSSVNMLHGCRNVDEFERLNKINEGTYGVVYRARDKKTGEIVALKKVKMAKEREGFPLTSLREINILLSVRHPSIVGVKEVVVGSNLDSIFMVMEYMDHDLKALMEAMKQRFSQSEVKCLMLQLLEGIDHLHDNWVLHRDLKTSNILLNNCGELKICDFGLSRQYGSPLKPYTHLVVTLWYRAPELLLGAKEYSTAIDTWSLGCIMAELLAKEPLFCGKSEVDQLDKIFRTLGTPNETIWPGFTKLRGVKVNFIRQPYNKLREKFPPITSFSGRPTLSEAGFDLLNKLLTYDPEKRITAKDALNHPWFREVPLPKSKEFMPTFPAQNELDRCQRRIMRSPDPLEEQRRKELQQGELGTGGLFG